MKMSVLYATRTDNTKEMAEIIVKGMNSIADVNAKAMSIDNIDAEFLKASQCVVMGAPTHLASTAIEMMTWLHTAAIQYGFAGKIGGAFATAGYIHGGGELVISDILRHMMVYGMLTYSGGAAFDHPVIHLGPVAIANKLSESHEMFLLYGQRMAQKTKEIFE